jgi:hypothetical protein
MLKLWRELTRVVPSWGIGRISDLAALALDLLFLNMHRKEGIIGCRDGLTRALKTSYWAWHGNTLT